jgi:hypothetical protein
MIGIIPGIVIAITPEPVIGMPGTLIGIVRNPQRKASETISLPKIIGIVLLNVLLGIALALGPFVLGLPANCNPIQLTNLDVDGLRTRLRKMSDEELRKFGKAARYMISARANMGKPPLPTFVLQLEEARAEWRTRHPGAETK